MGAVIDVAQLLKLEGRRRIFDYVRSRPGSHLRKIQRDLGLPLGTLEYHLYVLERAGLLAVRQSGRFKAFFVEGSMDRRDKDLLYYLRQSMPRRITMQVVHRPGITFQGLSARMPLSPSTVSFHLRKLVHAGILREQRVGREKIYECPEPERVQRLIVSYRPTFADEIVDRFAEAWLELGLSPRSESRPETDVQDAPESGDPRRTPVLSRAIRPPAVAAAGSA